MAVSAQTRAHAAPASGGSSRLKDFKAFVLRGNVLDLAVAVIVGASFGKIVPSLVNDILMPPLGLLVGKVDFGSLFLSLTGTPYASLADAQAAGAPTLNYGVFVMAIVDFLIVALVMFLLIRAVSQAQRGRPAEAPAPTTKECPFCCSSVNLKATRCPHCTAGLRGLAASIDRLARNRKGRCAHRPCVPSKARLRSTGACRRPSAAPTTG